jgi:hypothetical protein
MTNFGTNFGPKQAKSSEELIRWSWEELEVLKWTVTSKPGHINTSPMKHCLTCFRQFLVASKSTTPTDESESQRGMSLSGSPHWTITSCSTFSSAISIPSFTNYQLYPLRRLPCFIRSFHKIVFK